MFNIGGMMDGMKRARFREVNKSGADGGQYEKVPSIKFKVSEPGNLCDWHETWTS